MADDDQTELDKRIEEVVMKALAKHLPTMLERAKDALGSGPSRGECQFRLSP